MEWDEIRAAAFEAADSAASLVELISNDDLPRPALGDWDVRGLTGHLLRALRTPLGYLDEPEPTDTPLGSAAAYYGRYLGWRARDPERADDAVASRGAAELGHETVVEIQDAYREAARELRRLGDHRGDRLLPTAFGSMFLRDYIRTRILEMVAHALDLARALGEDWDVPEAPLLDAIRLIGEIAVVGGDGGALLMELTGRDTTKSVLPVLR